jgi:acetyl esterase
MTTTTTTAAPVLEPAAQAFAEATANPPFLSDLPPSEGRALLDEVQSGEIAKPDVDEEWVTVAGGPTGAVKVRIVKPRGATGTLPVVLYIHGAGWVFGDAHTHDRLVRELAVGVGAAVVFPEYDRSPEVRYPVAIEQSYAVARWVVEDGDAKGLDAARFAVAGDSVGGNMAAALTLMAKDRRGPKLAAQVLFYPVTDANFDTTSYEQFAEGYYLRRDAMPWFWDQYTTDEAQRNEITASPLRATREQLAGLPPALVITAEADVLRDEGEAYASKLRDAGVPVTAVRYQGMIHDFVMLNALRETYAADAAIRQAIAFLNQEMDMSTTEAQTASPDPTVGKVDMNLEVHVIPVSDVDRSKQFYERLGWRLDDDASPLEGLRIVQFTPPGSGTSVDFGKGLTAAAPGSALAGLVVSDIEAAHGELVGRGIDVSDVWHGPPFPPEARQPGVDPERASYGSFCSFSDPDGNVWLVQEVTTRLPGRVG